MNPLRKNRKARMEQKKLDRENKQYSRNKSLENKMRDGNMKSNPMDQLNRLRMGDRQRIPNIADLATVENRERQPINRLRIGDRQKIPNIVDLNTGENRERQPLNFGRLRSQLRANENSAISNIPPMVDEQSQKVSPQASIQQMQSQMTKPQQIPQQAVLNQPNVGPQQQQQMMMSKMYNPPATEVPKEETEEEKLKRLGISQI